MDIVLISRPFSHISSIIQAGGRGGRLTKDGSRKKVLVYLLYNSTDIRPNTRHMSLEVKNFYNDDSCSKMFLHNYFSNSEKFISNGDWCCSFHDNKK